LCLVFYVACITEIEALQASVNEMEKKYIELEKKNSANLNTHTKLEEELESKDKKLIQYKKESEKAIKKLAGKVSKLRSKLDAACFNSDCLSE
jgi:predicted  nucleic acid-binding Zn-ribbon protein